MRTYNKGFKEEAVKLSDEVGVHQAAEQLGIHITRWRAGVKNERPIGTRHILGARYLKANRLMNGNDK